MSSGEVSKADSPKSGDTATEDRQVTSAAVSEQVTSSQENTECNVLDISQSHASEGSSSDATDINKASTSDSDSQSVSCSSTIPEKLARTGSSIPTLTSTTRQPKAAAQRKSNNTVGQNTVKQGNAAIQNFVQNVTQRQNMMANMPLGVPGNMGHMPVRGGLPAGVTSILGPVPRTLGPPPNFGARPPGFGSNMMNIPAGNFGVQAGNNMFGNTSGTIGSGFGTSCGFNNPAIGQMACGPRLSPFNNSSFPNTIRPGAQMIPCAPNRGPTAPCVTGIGQQPMINLPNLNQPPPGYMPQVQHPRQLHSPRRSRSRDRSPYRRRRRSRTLSRSRSPRSRSRSWGRRSYSRDRSLSRGRSYNRDRSLSYERSPRRGSPNRVWSPRPKVRSRSRDRSTSRSPDFRHRLWSRSRSRSRSQPPREDYALSPRFGSSHGSSRPKKFEDDYAIGDTQYRVGGWLRKQHHREDYTMDSRSANPSYGRSDMRAVRHQLSSSEQSDDKSDALRVIRAKMKIKGKATPDEAQRSVVNCLYELLGRGGSASSSSTSGAVPTGSGERSSSSMVHHAESSSIYNPPSKQHHTQINTVSNSTDIFALFTEAPPELKGKQTATGMKAGDSYFDKPHSTRDDDRPYSLERDDQVSSTTPAANPSVDLGSTSVSRDAQLGSTSKVSISSPSDKPPVLRATSSAMDDLDSCNYARTKNSIDFMSMVSKLASKPPTRLHRTLSDPPDPDRWFRLSHQDEIQLEERKKQSANAAFLHTVLTELFGSTPRLARALADEKFTKLVPAMERIIKNENIANKDKVKMLTVIVKNAREAMHL